MVGREVDGQHVLSLHFCLLYVRLMVEFEVDGPLWVVLGRFRGLCGWSWNGLGASVGGLGPLSGPMWPVLGFLNGYVGGPGVLLGPLLTVLGRSWGLCSRSWAVLGSLLAVPGRLGPTLWCYVGGLGSLLGPMLADLAALGASVGGPGPSWAEKCRRI